jgi:DNA polymerase I
MTLIKLLQRYAGRTRHPRAGEKEVLTTPCPDEPDSSPPLEQPLSVPEESTARTPRVAVMSSFEPATVTYITESAQLDAAIPMLCEARVLIVGHNLKFDPKFLVAAGLPWPMGEILDTMLAVQVLGAGTSAGLLKGNSLEAVVKRYLGISLDKTAQTSDWSGPLSDTQLRYAAIDAAILLPLADALDTALQSAGLTRIATLEGDAMRALAWMEWTGLPVDVAQWEAQAAEDRQQADAARATVQTILDDSMRPGEKPINWQSSAQVLRLLQARGHAITRVDAPTLLPLKGHDPLIAALLAYREATKRTSTYGNAWL